MGQLTLQVDGELEYSDSTSGCSTKSARYSFLGQRDRSTNLLIGAEDVFNVSEPVHSVAFHCVLYTRLEPRHIGWVTNDPVNFHVRTAGRSPRFRAGVRGSIDECAARAPGLVEAEGFLTHEERRDGPMPVGGLLRRISSPDGLLVGDVADLMSPLTAGWRHRGITTVARSAGTSPGG